MTIVAAVDRSERASRVVAEAAEIAAAFDDTVHVVHALTRSEFLDLGITSAQAEEPKDMSEIRDAAGEMVAAAVAAYALTGRFASAFSPSTLRTVGTDGSYAVAWVVAIVVGFLAQVVGGVFTLTLVGAVLVPFVTFYGNVAGAYAIGTGVAETALGPESSDTESPAGRPAV